MAASRVACSIVIWTLLWTVVCPVGRAASQTLQEDEEDEEVAVEDEEDTMSLSATRPVSGLSQDALQKVARTRFASLDTNEDGRLDPDELKNAHPSIITPDQLRRLLMILDADGDGFVSESEMVAAATPTEDETSTGRHLSAVTVAGVLTLFAASGAGLFLYLQQRNNAVLAGQHMGTSPELRAARLRQLGYSSSPSPGSRDDDRDRDRESGAAATSTGATALCEDKVDSEADVRAVSPPSPSAHGTAAQVPGVVSAADGSSEGGSNGGGGGSSGGSTSSGGGSSIQGGSASASSSSAGVGSSSGAGGNGDDDDSNRRRGRKVPSSSSDGADNVVPEDDEEKRSSRAGSKEESAAGNAKQGEEAQAISDGGDDDSPEPAAKRAKEPSVDVRAKRLARFQSSQSDAPTGSSGVESSPEKSPTKAAHAVATSTVVTTPPSKAQSTSTALRTPTSKDMPAVSQSTPTEKKGSKPIAKKALSPAFSLSSEDAVGQVLSFVLHMNLTSPDGKLHSCADTQCSFTATSDMYPTAADVSTPKVAALFRRRCGREVEAGRFCLACYNRAEDRLASLTRSSNGSPPTEIILFQQKLLEDVQEVATSCFLEQLINTSQTSSAGDLWSRFAVRGEIQRPFCSLLARFSSFVSDGVGISPACLKKLMELAAPSTRATSVLMELIRAGGDEVMVVKNYDELPLRFNTYSDALRVIIAQPTVQNVLASTLSAELMQCDQGSFFQRSCVLSNLLNVTTLQFPLNTKNERLACFKALPGFPQAHSDACHTLFTQIQVATQGVQGLVHGAMLSIIRKADIRESALSWLAGALCTNYSRTAAQFKGHKPDVTIANDGFMVNMCAVMLRLCQPIFTSVPSDRLKKIDPSYLSQAHCRLDMNGEACLAGGRLDNSQRLKDGMVRFCMKKTGDGSANFLTECFYMTQLALYVGLMPTIRRFSSALQDLQRAQQGKSGKELEDLKASSGLFYLSWSTCLLDPELARQCCEFYVTQAVWITMLLASAEAEGGGADAIRDRQRQVLASIPEFSVKEMASWFSLLVQHQASSLQGIPLTALVDCCVVLLERPDLLPSPLAQTRIVELLLVFLETSKRSGHGQSGGSWGGGVRSQLASIVHACPAVQEQLGPALLHTYAAVDVIEGLDVDRESFDKFSARAHIQQLLEHIWQRPDCKHSVIAQAGSARFKRFLNANLDTLLYQMNDALRRVTNVRQLEVAKADEATWSKLSAKEKAEKEAFLRSEENVGSGFMKMAANTLDLLRMVIEEPAVVQMFWQKPLSIRAAAAVIEFTDSLCGGQRSELKVKDKNKMNFNPRQLVLSIVTIAVHMAGLLKKSDLSAAESPSASAELVESSSESENGFLLSLAEHPDYSVSTMERTAQVLKSCPGVSDHIVDAFTSLQSKVQVMVDATNKDMPSLEDLVVETDDSMDMSGEVATSSTAWQDAIDAVNLQMDGVADLYVEALREVIVDTVEELAEVHALKDNMADQPLDARSPKVRALMREVMQLSSNLPLHPNSSIFLRQDEDRLDVIRAVITGPVDTPYSHGCLAFDIYCPASYPNNPPLVKLITTGNGTVRFNPNLYADGKVCLSLLGTWHGGDASEKWDASTSSVYQVLVSIQGMILIPDPMYNEPGYERMRGTAEGNERSRKYNSSIRLSTVRYAMLGMLRSPPLGFEDIINVHFTIQKDVVLRQLSTWLRECQTPQEERKLRRAVDDLRMELDKL